MQQIVADASPLICLAAVGYLQLLAYVTDEILVPGQVWTECVVQGQGKPGADILAQAGFVRVLIPTDQSLVQRLQGSLDLGESEAIALAKELAVPLLVDERRARHAAVSEGVAIFGIVGLLQQLNGEGILADVKPVVDALLAAGWRISDALLQVLLAG